MATTTFSGPVVSNNGFDTGTSASPLAVTTAENVNAAFATTSAASGDTRLSYNRLTFTSTGSGETLRAFSIVTGTAAATAGTINGAHISLEVNGSSASISGAANAIRATLGGTDASPGGTLAVIQLDTNYTVNANFACYSPHSFVCLTAVLLLARSHCLQTLRLAQPLLALRLLHPLEQCLKQSK
jgi:hypothetical protein